MTILERDKIPGNILDRMDEMETRMAVLERRAITYHPAWFSEEYTQNVRDYGAVGDGITDDTTAIQAAYAAAFAQTYGGVVYFPAGKYVVTGLDFHETVANFNKHVLLVGDNNQASQIVLNTTDVGIDCLGAYGLQFENLYITSGASAPTVGLLFARSTTSNTCGQMHLKDVWVWGNFTQAAVAHIGAENMHYDTCIFNNLNADGGVSFYLSNYATGVKMDGAGGYETFVVASALGTIYVSSNTNNRWTACEFYGYGTENIPLSVESQAHASFFGCMFIPAENGAPCVLISDLQSTPFQGPILFTGCLFEGNTPSNGIELYSTRSSPSWRKINVVNNYFNLYGSGQFAVTYAGAWSGTHAVYGLDYSFNHMATTVSDVVRLNYVQESTINMPNGELQILKGLNTCQIRAETYTFLISVEGVDWINTTRELWSAALPVTGVYFIGERIYNSEPAASEFIGWVPQGFDGGGYTSARANSTSYANGTWLMFSDVSCWEKTAGTGTTAGSEPSVSGKVIGDTVVDGDFTMTKRSNYVTFFKGFGAIEA